MSTVTLGNSDNSNDTSAINAAIQSAANGSGRKIVQGKAGEIYRVADVQASRDDIELDFKCIAASSANGRMGRVTASNVTLWSGFEMDLDNKNNVHTGIKLEDGSNGFRARLGATGGFKNQQYTGTSENASFIHIKSVEDFESHGGRGVDQWATKKACRAFYFNPGGSGPRTLKDVLISGFYHENCQSTNSQEDAETIVVQSYKLSNYRVGGYGVIIQGCTAVNGAKRFAKFQCGHGKVIGNKVDWVDYNGPLGRRRLRCFVFNATGTVIIENNEFTTHSNRMVNAIVDITSDQYRSEARETVIRNNRIELKQRWTEGGDSGAFVYFQHWASNNRLPFPCTIEGNELIGPSDAMKCLYKFSKWGSSVNSADVSWNGQNGHLGNSIDTAMYGNDLEERS